MFFSSTAEAQPGSAVAADSVAQHTLPNMWMCALCSALYVLLVQFGILCVVMGSVVIQ